MSSRRLVDPELLPILDAAPSMAVSAERLPFARAAIAEMTRMGLEDSDRSVAVSEHFATGRNGSPDVRIIIYRPHDLPSPAPLVLQIHGGGFLFGTAELGDPRNRAMAKAVRCAVASVDYRLAPEAPFPAALDDCYTALEWLHREADSLALDPTRIAVRGESAGGGLAASLCILARDRGGPPIAFQLLVYPMLDDRTCVQEPHPVAGEYVWDGPSNQFGWESWLGESPGTDHIPPLAAPARVDDLRGLPATFLGTAALDMFIDEDLAYAQRLIRSGVPTEVYVAPGAFHGFEAMAPQAAVSQRFIAIGDQALRTALRT
jgi:acetyl esterase/lipase